MFSLILFFFSECFLITLIVTPMYHLWHDVHCDMMSTLQCYFDITQKIHTVLPTQQVVPRKDYGMLAVSPVFQKFRKLGYDFLTSLKELRAQFSINDVSQVDLIGMTDHRVSWRVFWDKFRSEVWIIWLLVFSSANRCIYLILSFRFLLCCLEPWCSFCGWRIHDDVLAGECSRAL